MLRDLRGSVGALLLYSAFYTAFFLRSLLTGNYIAPSDSLDFGVAAFLSSPGLWTQGMYAGYPIAADPQALTWYPLLHTMRAAGLDWNAFLIAAYVIASTTAFLFVRRLTGSALAGLFAGFTYGFSGVMLGHIGHFNQIHAAAWVPLALYGLRLVREGEYRGGTAIAAAGFAMTWLAGHPQVPVYTAYLAGALVLGELLIDRPPPPVTLARLKWSAVAMALGIGLAAVMILPMIELGELSRRSESNWDLYISKALPARQLLGLALPFAFGGFWSEGQIPVPYFGLGGPAENTGYVGLLPLALALAAPLLLVTHRRDARLWMAVTVVALLLCLGAATPIGTLFFYAPGYASFRVPARHLFVVSLCLSVVAGLAFAELTRDREGRGRIALAVAASLAAMALMFALLAAVTPQVRTLLSESAVYRGWALGWPAAFGALCIVVALAGRQFGRRRAAAAAFGVLLLALHIVDLTMLHYRMPGYRLHYADIVRAEAVPHPRMMELREELVRTGERALATDGSRNQFLLPNLTRPWGIPSAGGTGSLGLERYLDVLGMGGPGDVYPETLSSPHRGLDLFGVRYALVPRGSPLEEEAARYGDRWTPVEDLEYYANDPDTYYTLYRNARAMPRAWCAAGVVRATAPEALRAIRTGELPGGGTFDPLRMALVEPETMLTVTPGGEGEDGPADEVLVDVSGDPRYLVTTDVPCVLVLSEVHYPWWRATLDGADADIVRVNHTMIGVPVPAGSHVVRLRLEPRSVWLGGGIGAVSLLLWLAVLAVPPRRRHRSNDPV